MKLKTISISRCNGGAAAKIRYGSSTLTTFAVYKAEDEYNYTKHVIIKDVGGKTPGERASRAKELAEPKLFPSA
jgi:hypothetical protein